MSGLFGPTGGTFITVKSLKKSLFFLRFRKNSINVTQGMQK